MSKRLWFKVYNHNPNAIQLAILARLIELRPKYYHLGQLFNEKGLKAEEILCTEALWKIYQARQLLNETLDLISDL